MKKIYLLASLIFFGYEAYSQELNIRANNYSDTSVKDRSNIIVSVPYFDFGPDALMGVRGIAMDMNEAADSILNPIVSEFKKSAEENSKTECPSPESTLEINYTVIYKNNGIVSITFDTFSDIRCMAHPMTYINSFNYSYTGKGLITVEDLFISGSEGINYVSGYCIKELKETAKKNGMENINDMIESGASAKPENFKVFTVSDAGLIVIFPFYQAGPYVMGIQKIYIPWQGMKKLIDPAGPVGFVLK